MDIKRRNTDTQQVIRPDNAPLDRHVIRTSSSPASTPSLPGHSLGPNGSATDATAADAANPATAAAVIARTDANPALPADRANATAVTLAAGDRAVSSVTLESSAPMRRTLGHSVSADSEAQAIIQQALREHELERSDDLSSLRDSIMQRRRVHDAVAVERRRANEALALIRTLPQGTRLNPPFVPQPIDTSIPGTRTLPVPPPPPALEFEIDGKTLTLPPEIYRWAGFDDALKVIDKIRELPSTTGGAQGCGGGVRNDIVSNAFQFLATRAILYINDGSAYGANADMDYSIFVQQLEQYGISATADQADGVGGGTVTLEGGHKVQDGVSDGNLDFKDLEWNKSSQALADALGIQVGDLITDKTAFDAEYAAISHLLSDNNFNPADNDLLVEVLLVASMIEKAGRSADAAGTMSRGPDIERYVRRLDNFERNLSSQISERTMTLLSRFPNERLRPEFADLGEAAPGSENAPTTRTRAATNEQPNGATARSARLMARHSAITSMTANDAATPSTRSANVAGAPSAGVAGRGMQDGPARPDVAMDRTLTPAGLGQQIRAEHSAAASNTNPGVAHAADAESSARATTLRLDTDSFVAHQANRLTQALREEHSLKLKLLDLDLGPQAAASLARNQQEAWDTLGRLRSINMDQKLPVMRELAGFIMLNRSVLDGNST